MSKYMFINSIPPQTVTTISKPLVSPQISVYNATACFFLIDTLANLTANPASSSNGHYIAAAERRYLTVQDPSFCISISAGTAYISGVAVSAD